MMFDKDKNDVIRPYLRDFCLSLSSNDTMEWLHKFTRFSHSYMYNKLGSFLTWKRTKIDELINKWRKESHRHDKKYHKYLAHGTSPPSLRSLYSVWQNFTQMTSAPPSLSSHTASSYTASSLTEVSLTSLADRFDVKNPLGSGACGHVVRAIDTSVGSTVAIKCMLKSKLCFTRMIRDRERGYIPKEAFIISRLNHPNIIRFVDILQDDLFYFLITECPTTRDLFDFIEEHGSSLPESRCRNIFKQLISAIDYVHQSNYVHRDIKDENVLIDDNDNIFVIDFGNSNHIPTGYLEYFTDLCGTPHAMAPEVYKQQPHQGVKQDIWALGILLYTLLYGECPFENDQQINLGVRKTIREDHQKRSDLVMDLLDKMLEIDVGKRFTMEEIKNHEWMMCVKLNEIVSN